MKSKEKRKRKWRSVLQEFDSIAKIDDYLFVHAGVNPSKSLSKQNCLKSLDLNQMLRCHEKIKGRWVVHGHVPTRRYGAKKNRIYIKGHTIDIDTGAGHGERLSLVDLTHQQVCSIEVEQLKKYMSIVSDR